MANRSNAPSAISGGTKTGHWHDSSSAISNITQLHAHPSQKLSQIFVKHAKNFLNDNYHRISLKWTKGHRDIAINETADRLAKEGCHTDQNLISLSLSYLAEKRSKHTLKTWRKDFTNKRPTGAFGEVTFQPPSTKPDKVFIQLASEPEVFGRLTQLRTMHGYNPPYYHRFNIDHDLACACGTEFYPHNASSYREHILNSCDKYLDHRAPIWRVSRNGDPTILLGSIKGLLTVAKFLKDSGALTATGEPYHPPRPPEMPELELNIPNDASPLLN
jgi:hypothetical protein